MQSCSHVAHTTLHASLLFEVRTRNFFVCYRPPSAAREDLRSETGPVDVLVRCHVVVILYGLPQCSMSTVNASSSLRALSFSAAGGVAVAGLVSKRSHHELPQPRNVYFSCLN